jgi:hypothetical protein
VDSKGLLGQMFWNANMNKFPLVEEYEVLTSHPAQSSHCAQHQNDG